MANAPAPVSVETSWEDMLPLSMATMTGDGAKGAAAYKQLYGAAAYDQNVTSTHILREFGASMDMVKGLASAAGIKLDAAGNQPADKPIPDNQLALVRKLAENPDSTRNLTAFLNNSDNKFIAGLVRSKMANPGTGAQDYTALLDTIIDSAKDKSQLDSITAIMKNKPGCTKYSLNEIFEKISNKDAKDLSLGELQAHADDLATISEHPILAKLAEKDAGFAASLQGAKSMLALFGGKPGVPAPTAPTAPAAPTNNTPPASPPTQQQAADTFKGFVANMIEHFTGLPSQIATAIANFIAPMLQGMGIGA